MKKIFNLTQIKTLLWKEYLVRIRQPWMTAIQFIWPILLLLSLCVLRLRFVPADIEACQFPSRQLPTQTSVLTFFQSYICTIDNACLNATQYEEYSKFQEAPITPLLNIVQTFMNDDGLFNAVVGLPDSGNFLNLAISVFTHAKFSYLKENLEFMQAKQSEYIEKIGDNFDITKIWNNDEAFSIFGNILCGKPFPRSNEIKLVENIFYHTDYAGPDKDELDAMPTPYCKQLYLDVTNTNHGKITWHQIKPIIQGKIIYGPNNENTENIINHSNGTFESIKRLRQFVNGIQETVVKLRTNVEFKSKLDGLVTLAKSSFAATLLGGSIDSAGIDNVYNVLVNDETIATVIITISNILDCLSVDRFVPVNTESELILYANELNDKKLFYGGLYFKDGAQTFNETKKIEYTLRMEIDNTPITIRPRQQFWFPGPEASFTQDMRYHRGFIEIQHAIDTGIIKHIKKSMGDIVKDGTVDGDDGGDENKTTTTPENKVNIDLGWGDINDDDDDNNNGNAETSDTTTPAETSTENLSVLDFNLDDFLNFDEVTTTVAPIISTTENTENVNNGKLKQRKRRGILSGLFDNFVSGSNTNEKTIKLESDDIQYYTKQFPYPKYRNDEFKRGLYLAQAIQMAFFLGLIVQIAASVRQRLWMKESGNRRLMQIMGLLKSSELIAWLIVTMIELEIITGISCLILYAGGMIQSTSILLLFSFFTIFCFSVLSFCYMTSSIFTSASIGCVSSSMIFLTSFTPYIIIISLSKLLTTGQKFIANLSPSTAFCYALHFVMRTELQQKPFNFSNAFTGTIESNDFKFGVFMIIFDSIIFMLIGYLFERLFDDEYKLHKVTTKFTSGIGASMINVTKIFDQNSVPAVDNVSIEFRRDHVTCLLGRNGAGKSTIINLLTGQVRATSGEIYLSPTTLNDEIGIKEFVGLCPQNMVLIPTLTAKEHLYLYASIKLDKGYLEEVERILEGLNFGKHELYRCENLSGGFKRRLNVGIAFIGSPNLVILDEPCNAVDSKARKQIWDTINVLKKGRAVILATHYMDEAEFLSDNVIFLNGGQIISEHNMKSIKDQITESFDVKIKLTESLDRSLTIERIRNFLIDLPHERTELDSTGTILLIKAISYYDKDKNNNQMVNYESLIRSLEKLQNEKKIQCFNVISKDLEGLFNSFVEETTKLNLKNNKQQQKQFGDSPVSISINGSTVNANNIGSEDEINKLPQMVSKLTEQTMIKMLFWKRLMHFKRNYRLILCMLVAPTIFTAIAMALLNVKPPGEFDINLKLSTDLYNNSKEFISLENPMKYTEKLTNRLHCDNTSDSTCEHFNSSANAFNWILNTHDDYVENRYGGISMNGSTAAVWYNNKGFHAMPVWLNKLSSALLNAEMNDEEYKIITHNHPLIMGRKEMSSSSILHQVADGGVSIILLISFSLVVAGSSVYIVNERTAGEKLQQKLCGVSFRTYWGVAFIWDLMIYSIALVMSIIVLKSFDIAEYTGRENLYGVIVLIFMFGFASIPMVHLFEKRFNDASLANMHVLCLNIIIAIVCRMIIILFDLLGTSDLSETIRNFLNRIFLVFPQFAFGDGLVEIVQNYIIASIFERYSIDTYKPPLRSDLLLPHLLSLFIFGIIFSILNYLIESGRLHHWSNKLEWFQNIGEKGYDLQTASSLPTLAKTYDKFELSNQDYVLRVNNLYKAYRNEYQNKQKQQQHQLKHQWAVRNVSFNINVAECFGLLGVNGAGKSTIFSILSGQLRQTTGTVDFMGNNGISYCPQTNALDTLLTVEEVIRFYGKLRKIQNLDWLITKILTQFHMEQYRHVLVKNLSGGNRRKLSVAVTCLGDTNLVLMDEPTSDMDPITRSLVYKSIHQLINERRSVLLTSHTITEMDRVCHRIGVLQEGQLISVGSTDQLKTLFGSNYLITIFYDEQCTTVNVLEKNLLDILGQTRLDGIVYFKQCLQFSIKIDVNDKNRTLSNIFDKMYKLCQNSNNMGYTISECLLDKAFERVIDSSQQVNGNNETYANGAFILNETST